MRKWRRRAIKRQSYELWMKTTTNHQIQRDAGKYECISQKKLPNQIGFFFTQHHRKNVERFFATVSTQTDKTTIESKNILITYNIFEDTQRHFKRCSGTVGVIQKEHSETL